MARIQTIQSSLITGVIAPTLIGRIDLEKYYNAVAEAENVVISPHGGMIRRDGLKHLTQVVTGSRLFSFEFNIDQNYVFVLTTDDLIVYLPNSSTPLATVPWITPLTTTQLNDMDIIQSADTTIITHEDFKPLLIKREGSDADWDISEMALTNIPTFNFGSGNEPVWSNTRGWVRTCTFFQGRLCFGGSKSKPTSVWCSVVNDFFNFDTGGTDVQADDAIFDVLDTDQYNAINNIVASRTLQVLTAGGEFTNSAEILTPNTSAWVRETGYGASRIKPVVLDGATYFMDRFKKTVRGFIYDYNEGGYTTPPISILASHIINDVQDLDIVRGSSISVSNLLYLINGDGTVAVFNTMRKENISGWTKWTTTGLFKRVTVTSSVVSFIIERDGVEYLEMLDDTVLLDHTFSDVDSDRVAVDTLLQSEEIRIVADDVTQTGTTTTGTEAVADRQANVIYAGLNYPVKIKTLPISVNTPAGNFVNQLRRITKATVNLYESRGVYLNGNLVTSRKFGTNNLDLALTPITGIESVYLLGYNKQAAIEITQTNPEPMTILALDLEVSY